MLGSKASELRSPMLVAGCASDHVHVVVRVASSVALSELVMHLKGATARELNSERSASAPFAWQDGYWAESFGPSELGPIAEYVRRQREHHDDSHPFERWMAAVTE